MLILDILSLVDFSLLELEEDMGSITKTMNLQNAVELVAILVLCTNTGHTENLDILI